MTNRLAIDIGYGDTKVCVASDSQSHKYFKFPTAISRQKESMADFGDNAGYVYNGVRYNVGKQAVSDAFTTRGFDFMVKYAPLIAYHAFGSKLNGAEIATGLSIINWSERQRYFDALSRIIVDSKVVVPAKVVLYAQGQGIIDRYHGDKSGLICVVDIGYNTFDFLVFEDGKPSKELSFATNQGTNKIVTDLQAIIKKRFNVDLLEAEAKEIFENKKMVMYSNEIDLSDHITEALDFYNEFIINEVKSKRIDVLRKAKKVIFAGGGAYYLEDKRLPGNAIFIDNPYEFANVRGYYEHKKD